MEKSNFLKQVIIISQSMMNSDKKFHDFVHTKNVYFNIKTLLKYEEADETILLTAALLHDIRRECNNHGTEGSLCAREILKSIEGISEEFIGKVCEIIYSHDKRGFQDTCDKRVFYDADKMDAFSDFGLIRSFMMYALENLTIKESCNRYIEYIDSTYNSLFFNISKELIHKDYLKNRDKALEMLMNYYKIDLIYEY
ncbi:HD domain-containing protein [Clostridium sp. UBA4548]|uniref:HD domain-containing protein n=1 Tax=Clostridium sp. UBA4548 TaxID=1946361 RepID=UPI0025C614C4|nr:HD domain-containing protein [Clostridium sp. UBA4548]